MAGGIAEYRPMTDEQWADEQERRSQWNNEQDEIAKILENDRLRREFEAASKASVSVQNQINSDTAWLNNYSRYENKQMGRCKTDEERYQTASRLRAERAQREASLAKNQKLMEQYQEAAKAVNGTLRSDKRIANRQKMIDDATGRLDQFVNMIDRINSRVTTGSMGTKSQASSPKPATATQTQAAGQSGGTSGEAQGTGTEAAATNTAVTANANTANASAPAQAANATNTVASSPAANATNTATSSPATNATNTAAQPSAATPVANTTANATASASNAVQSTGTGTTGSSAPVPAANGNVADMAASLIQKAIDEKRFSGNETEENLKLALEVIRGTFKNGEERVTNMGTVTYGMIQPIVNKYYGLVKQQMGANGQTGQTGQETNGQDSQTGQGANGQGANGQATQGTNGQTGQVRGGWVNINGKQVYLEGVKYEAWLRKKENEKPSYAQSLGDAFGAYFSGLRGGGVDPSGVSTGMRTQADISERMGADYQQAAQASRQIANQNPYDEADKMAAAQAAQQNAQNVLNLGNASAGAAALARGTAEADYKSQIARMDEQRAQAVQNQALAGEMRGAAQQARNDANERDYMWRDMAKDNLERERIARAGRNESTGEEDEEQGETNPDEKEETNPDEQGDTNPDEQGNTNPDEQGNTNPDEQGNTNPDEQGNTNPDEQGNTNPDEQGNTNPDEQGDTNPDEQSVKEETGTVPPAVKEKEDTTSSEAEEEDDGVVNRYQEYGTRKELIMKHGSDGEFTSDLNQYKDLGNGYFTRQYKDENGKVVTDGKRYQRAEVTDSPSPSPGQGRMFYYWPVSSGGSVDVSGIATAINGESDQRDMRDKDGHAKE